MAVDGTLSASKKLVNPGDATNQARFLAHCAREYGAAWPRLSSREYPGERLLRTAYSTYRVVDGRCIVVQRAGEAREDDEHECLGTYLVGFLLRHDDDERGARWSLHAAPRPGTKAVFWRPLGGSTGHFVVTSRLADPAPTQPENRPPTRTGPPPLPVRATPLAVSTPTTGVEARGRAPRSVPRQAPGTLAVGRAPARALPKAAPPPPPPPRFMKRDLKT